MKRLFTSIVSMLLVNLAFAGPIDKSTAYQLANEFIQTRHMASTLAPVTARSAMHSDSSDSEAYYIFNKGDDQGFVIVSGSDCGNSILGYTDQGSFDPSNVPDGLALMLNLYEEQIKALEASGQASQASYEKDDNTPRRSISLARNAICPMDSFFFYSTPPYNAFCPVNDQGTHEGSGCASAAMSQIMAYWQYPEKTPLIPGYPCGQYTIDDIPSSPIDWNNILNSYCFRGSWNTSEVELNAIADLIYKAAVSVKVIFGTSGAPLSNIVPALTQYFGYSPEMRLENFFDLGMNKAEDIIYHDLSQGMPVLIGGSRMKVDPSDASHLWVIDGYDQDDFFHFNWGWNGHMNGYFRLSVISPYEHEMVWNYMLDMCIIHNIKPLGVKSVDPADDTYTKRLRNVGLLATNKEPKSISITLKNPLSQQYTFDQGLNLYNENGEFIETIIGEQVTLAPNETASITYMPDYSHYAFGKYVLRPVSKVAGEEKWVEDECYDLNAFVNFTLTSTNVYYYLVPSLTVNSLEREDHGPIYLGAPQILKLNVTNNTNEKFGRWINVFADDGLVQVRGGHIPANSTVDMFFGYEPTREGLINVKLCLAKENGNQLLTSYDLDVLPAKQWGNLLMDVTVDNLNAENDTVIHGDTFRAKIKVTNNSSIDYHDYLNFILRYNVQLETSKPLVDIPAGETKYYEFEFKGMERGGNYRFTTYYKKTSNSDFSSVFNDWFKCSFTPGYRYWTADGKEYAFAPNRELFVVPEEAVAVCVTGNAIQPTGFQLNSNPNTLFYVVGPWYDYLNNHNVVRDYSANKIVVHEGYPFYVPQEFFAKNISYTRNFAKGYGQDGTNWSTIVLPFAPQTVTDTQTGKEIDWYRSSNEVGKDFWIREFYSEDNNTLYFKDVEQFHAYRPYIIAVPDDTFGEYFDLTNRDIQFSAKNVQMKLNSRPFADAYNYNFEGTVLGMNCEGLNSYVLNEDNGGNAFVYTENAPYLPPYYAMFTSSFKPNSSNGPLRIAHHKDNVPTGINYMVNTTTSHNGVYTIDGRKIAVGNEPVRDILQNLPKGIYIINGRKYLK